MPNDAPRKYVCHEGCGSPVPVVGRTCEGCKSLKRFLTAEVHGTAYDPPAYGEFKRPLVDEYAARIAAGKRIFEATPKE